MIDLLKLPIIIQCKNALLMFTYGEINKIYCRITAYDTCLPSPKDCSFDSVEDLNQYIKKQINFWNGR